MWSQVAKGTSGSCFGYVIPCKPCKLCMIKIACLEEKAKILNKTLGKDNFLEILKFEVDHDGILWLRPVITSRRRP